MEIFWGYSKYWRDQGVALHINLNKDFRHQLYFQMAVGFGLLPEGSTARALATAYILRESASIVGPVSIVVELIDLVSLRFAMHATLLTPSHVEYRIPWMIETAKHYQRTLTEATAHRPSVLAPFPESYFAPVD